MKIKITAMLLFAVLNSNIHAQIKLDDVRNLQNQEQKEDLPIEESDSRLAPISSSNSNDLQKIKIKNLSSIIILNAAIVGYATQCKFNAQNIHRIESHFLKQYNIINEPLVLSKYREKVEEFKIKKTTENECRIFLNDFTLILKEVSKSNKEH